MGRVRAVPYVLAGVCAVLYAALGVLRYARMQATAFDLGIFTQAVRAYAELRAPTADLKGPGFPLLGDHFHPILATLAPAYAVFPSPVTLVVAQALLFAVSVVPVTRIGMYRLGTWPGALLGVAYGLSFGIQQAMVFDFHEIAFAVPLLAFAAEALLRERWAAAMWWTLPLLLVKEDQAALVVAVGGYLALRGQWRRGALLAGIGVAVGLLVLLVVIPAVNPSGEYPYFGTAEGGVDNPLVRLFAPAAKWHLVYLLLLCVGFLALLSPLTLVAAVPLALRFWTEKPAYWAVGFHYNSVLMPLLFVAAVDGLARLAGWLRTRPRIAPRVPWVTAAVAALVAGYAVVGTVRDQPLGLLLDPGQRRVSSTVVAAKRFLAASIPDGAVVAADNRIAPHLVSRCTVRMFPDAVDPRGNPMPVPRPPDTEWVAVREPPATFPLDPAAYRAYVATLPSRGYTLVGTEAGISVYRRGTEVSG